MVRGGNPFERWSALNLLLVCTMADEAPSSEKLDEPIVIDAVALAGCRFEAFTIDDCELAMMIAFALLSLGLRNSKINAARADLA
jgi:hypothetical protein